MNGLFFEGDNVTQIRGEWGRPYILKTNYIWCIYWDASDNGESLSHIRIYQHLGDLYSSSPVIHLALSTPDPFCFPSVWPIVTESNCRQKTTSNDYFIWESEREWKVTDRYFQQKEEAFFFFPDTQFQTTKNIIDLAEIRTPKQITKHTERTKCTKGERISRTTRHRALAPFFLLPLIKSML